ncbi:MAG: EamA family transporter [Bacillota bacterium]
MKPYIMVLTAGVLWGSGSLFVRLLQLQGLQASLIVLMRASMAWAILGLWILLSQPRLLRIQRRDIPIFLVLGFVGPALSQPLFITCVTLTSVALAALMNYTAPVFVAILARVFLKEPLTPRKITAVVLTVVGLGLLTGAWGALFRQGLNLSWLALATGLGSGVFYAIYTLVLKGLAPRYHPAAVQFSTMSVALPFLLAYAAFSLEGPPVIPTGAWPAAMANAILPGTVAFLLFTGGIRHIQAGKASITATIEPIATAILGLVFLDEGLGPLDILGMAMVLWGIVLASRPESQESTLPGPSPLR